jgi:hypothetical protein
VIVPGSSGESIEAAIFNDATTATAATVPLPRLRAIDPG